MQLHRSRLEVSSSMPSRHTTTSAVGPAMLSEGGQLANHGAPIGTAAVVCLVVLFLCLIIGSGYSVIAIWPPDCLNNQCAPHTARIIFWSFTIDRAENMLLLVAVAGALGALIHVTSSFADYVGNRQLVLSWVWWLLLRVPIGV